MKRGSAAVGWILLATGMALPGSALGQVWVEEATTKVLKSAEPGSAEALVEAAGNEWEGFQVVIRAGDDAMQEVTVELDDLMGPGGAVAAGQNVEMFLEYYVYIEKPSPCDPWLGLPDCGGIPEYLREPGWYPDALVPFYDPYSDGAVPVAVPFDVPDGDLQTVFVDVFVPQDTPAGDYVGQLRVRQGGVEIAALPVALRVWDFSLPAERSVATSYGLVFSYIKRYHGGPEGPDEETEAQLIRNYELALHRHRIDLEEYRASFDLGVDAQGMLLPIDFAEFDAEMGPRIEGGFFPDGAGINRFALKDFGPGRGHDDLTDDQWGEAARVAAEHLEEKGWLEHVYLYSLDEPWQIDKWNDGSYEKIARDVEVLRAHTDLWDGHVMVTGPWVSDLDDAVDIWCPDTTMYGGDYYGPGAWPGQETYAGLLAQGHELWFYVCRMNVPPFLGYDVDSKIGYEPRLLKWQAWHEHATGFLFWTVNYWNKDDPWNVPVTFPEKFDAEQDRNGNGILIYPGDHNGTKAPAGSPSWVSLDGPVMSYRVKQIRDGLEDWELFRLAEGLGAGAYARAQVERVHRAFAVQLDASFDPADPPWTLDEGELLDVRRNVALKVQHLLHPDRYQDPEHPEAEPAPDSELEALPEGMTEPLTDAACADVVTQDTDAGGSRHGRSGCGTTGMNARPGGGASFGLLLLAVLLAGAASRRARPRSCAGQGA